jgi:hypothetical protein
MKANSTRNRECSLFTLFLVGLKLVPLILSLSSCTVFSVGGAGQAFTYRQQSELAKPKINSAVLTYSYTNPRAPDYFKTRYDNALQGRNEKAGEMERNRILYELLGMVDDYYHHWTANLRGEIAAKNLFVDTTSVATSIAASAAGANEIKTILSAISAGSQTLSKSFDTNVLLNTSLQAVEAQMDADRSNLAKDMIVKMSKSTADYPLEAGLRDVINYYSAGTLTDGLSSLVANAGQSKTTAQRLEATASQGVSISTSSNTSSKTTTTTQRSN